MATFILVLRIVGTAILLPFLYLSVRDVFRALKQGMKQRKKKLI